LGGPKEKRIGISHQIAIKAISKATGISESQVLSEWKKIGECGVDAGCIMIVDPCYVLPDKEDSKPIATYNEFLYESFDKLKQEPGETDRDFQHRKNEHAMKPLEIFGGVIAPTRDGDGTFPVFAKYEGDDSRPTALMIDFSGYTCEGCGYQVSDTEELNECDNQGECCRECGESDCEGDHCECCQDREDQCDCEFCRDCSECKEHDLCICEDEDEDD